MSRRRHLCARVIVALTVAQCAYTPAYAAEPASAVPPPVCEGKLEPATTSVIAQPVRYTIDRSQDVRALSAQEHVGPDHRMLGRTVTKFQAATSLRLNNVRLVDGRFCLSPSTTVRVSLEPATIYIASDFAAGSCESQLILEHEQRHLAMSERQLAELAPALEADLRGLFAGGAVTAEDVSTAANLITRRTSEAIRARVAAAAEESPSRQAGIDSSDDIAQHMRASCGRRNP